MGLGEDLEHRETCELIVQLVARLGLRVVAVDVASGTVTVAAPEARSVRSPSARADT